jgi:hypothetical protein
MYKNLTMPSIYLSKIIEIEILIKNIDKKLMKNINKTIFKME